MLVGTIGMCAMQEQSQHYRSMTVGASKMQRCRAGGTNDRSGSSTALVAGVFPRQAIQTVSNRAKSMNLFNQLTVVH